MSTNSERRQSFSSNKVLSSGGQSTPTPMILPATTTSQIIGIELPQAKPRAPAMPSNNHSNATSTTKATLRGQDTPTDGPSRITNEGDTSQKVTMEEGCSNSAVTETENISGSGLSTGGQHQNTPEGPTPAVPKAAPYAQEHIGRRVLKFIKGSTSKSKVIDDEVSNSKKFMRKNVNDSVAKAVDIEDLTVNDVIIAFVNILTGCKDGVGHSLESCTTEIRIMELSYPHLNAKLVFVDTPGFDDTNKSDTEILDMLADWLKATYERQIKLSGILYLHRISDNRMAGTPLKNLKMFEKLCGKHALKNVVLASTMWDEVDEKIGRLREEELKGKYWKGMLSQGSATYRYDGTRDAAWDIVDHFLQNSYILTAVQLQQEMVDFKKQLPETKAGAELFGRLEELVKRQQKTLQNIQKEIQAHSDEMVLRILKEEFEDQRGQIQSTMNDMEKLKVPMARRLFRIFTSRLRF